MSNTDNGAPIVPIDSHDISSLEAFSAAKKLSPLEATLDDMPGDRPECDVYQGGSYRWASIV